MRRSSCDRMTLTPTLEYMPYVFQLFAALLEANSSPTLPPAFQPLVAPILAPPLWEQRGNVPALARLLSSMVPLASSDLARNGQIEPVLGIFQKLVSTKLHETQGFDLLESVVESFPSYVLSFVQREDDTLLTLTVLRSNPTGALCYKSS